MGEEKIILTLHFLFVKSELRTARLYRITSKSSMGEEKIILTLHFLGVKSEPRTARLYHGIQKTQWQPQEK